MDTLREGGIDECKCKKLSDTAKDGRTFRSAAFRFSFDIRFLDLVYDEATWPAYAEVREWVFHKRASDSGSGGN
jgi:hypothetical protein